MSPAVLFVLFVLGWMYFILPAIWEKSGLFQRLVMMLIVVGLLLLGLILGWAAEQGVSV